MAGDYLTVRTRRDGSACVLTVSGELDVVSAAWLLDAAAPAVAGDYQQFVLDLAELTFTDCCGARALAVLVRAVPDECALVVRSVQPTVRRLLDFTGIVLERMPRQEPVTAEDRTVPHAQDMQVVFSHAEATWAEIREAAPAGRRNA